MVPCKEATKVFLPGCGRPRSAVRASAQETAEQATAYARYTPVDLPDAGVCSPQSHARLTVQAEPGQQVQVGRMPGAFQPDRA